MKQLSTIRSRRWSAGSGSCQIKMRTPSHQPKSKSKLRGPILLAYPLRTLTQSTRSSSRASNIKVSEIERYEMKKTIYTGLGPPILKNYSLITYITIQIRLITLCALLSAAHIFLFSLFNNNTPFQILRPTIVGRDILINLTFAFRTGPKSLVASGRSLSILLLFFRRYPTGPNAHAQSPSRRLQ